MEIFVEEFVAYLKKQIVFENDENLQFVIWNNLDKKSNLFVIAVLKEEYYRQYENSKNMNFYFINASDLIISMDFEKENIIRVMKDLHSEYDIQDFLKDFFRSLPYDSEERELYEKNRKTYRIKWILES